jgi:hypothetical protein
LRIASPIAHRPPAEKPVHADVADVGRGKRAQLLDQEGHVARFGVVVFAGLGGVDERAHRRNARHDRHDVAVAGEVLGGGVIERRRAEAPEDETELAVRRSRVADGAGLERQDLRALLRRGGADAIEIEVLRRAVAGRAEILLAGHERDVVGEPHLRLRFAHRRVPDRDLHRPVDRPAARLAVEIEREEVWPRGVVFLDDPEPGGVRSRLQLAQSDGE